MQRPSFPTGYAAGAIERIVISVFGYDPAPAGTTSQFIHRKQVRFYLHGKWWSLSCSAISRHIRQEARLRSSICTLPSSAMKRTHVRSRAKNRCCTVGCSYCKGFAVESEVVQPAHQCAEKFMLRHLFQRCVGIFILYLFHSVVSCSRG